MIIEIPDDAITEGVKSLLREQIRRAKLAHYVNVKIRINGKDEETEADWLKYAEIITG